MGIVSSKLGNIDKNNSEWNSDINELSNDAKEIIKGLNIPTDISDSNVSEGTIKEIINKTDQLSPRDKETVDKIIQSVQTENQTTTDLPNTPNDTKKNNDIHTSDFSETSPFISPENYNAIINSNTSPSPPQQTGGNLEDDSSTSSTSSISDDDEEKHNKKEHKKHDKKHNKKNSKIESDTEESEDTDMTGGSLSYLSTTAHTGGDFSGTDNSDENNEVDDEEEDDEEEDDEEREDTITNENSINTSDLKMIEMDSDN